MRSPSATSPFVCRFPSHFLTLHAPHYGRSRVWMPAAPPNRPFPPCKAALVAAVCPRPKGGEALAENPLRRGQPAANQRGESGCRPYGGKPTRRGRLGRLINFRYRSAAPAKPSKIFTSICALFVACRSLRGPDPANLLKKPPVKVTFSAADHRGGGAGSVAVALPNTHPRHGACAMGPHFRRPPACCCRLRGDFCVCG